MKHNENEGVLCRSGRLDRLLRSLDSLIDWRPEGRLAQGAQYNGCIFIAPWLDFSAWPWLAMELLLLLSRLTSIPNPSFSFCLSLSSAPRGCAQQGEYQTCVFVCVYVCLHPTDFDKRLQKQSPLKRSTDYEIRPTFQDSLNSTVPALCH